MSTFQDFLIWYNNLDVGPFVQAVENLQKIYVDRGIDVFKTSISVPGLARRMLFDTGRQAGASFALFDEANSDLYDTIKRTFHHFQPTSRSGQGLHPQRFHQTWSTDRWVRRQCVISVVHRSGDATGTFRPTTHGGRIQA